jgi:putative nucleotidyltransferase with HDIG domain
MALACAETMGMSTAEATAVYRMGLLHDCGVSSTRVHKKLIDELDWQDSEMHCQIGAQRMSRFTPIASMAEVILYHHTRWDRLQKLPLSQAIKRNAGLIYLLDRVDALAANEPVPNRLAGKDAICKKMLDLRHTYFDPELVEIFLAASDSEAFWITMEPEHLPDFLQKRQPEADMISIDLEGLEEAASLFAQIVDAKSRYTAEHSTGVASLSRYLAERCGLNETVCCHVEVAGLLHDLGKLQVPDKVLERKGALSREDTAIMRHHSYVTFHILKKIRGLEDISLWAANHHEKLDGSGYPFRKTAEDLCLQSRIIIIADIFQALAQNRPYRPSQSSGDVVDFLQMGSEHGQLDADLVRIVASEPAACYAIALGEGQQ